MSQTSHTCITCHVAFTNPDVQRLHYKSDWHRYNLKRKVVALPPVSINVFQEKVAAQQAIAADNQSQENVSGVVCKVCQRKFNSINAHKNHLKSKKHKEAEIREIANMKTKLQEKSQVHIEKGTPDDIDVMEKRALEKALADAYSNMKHPLILKCDEQKNTTREFSKGDNPRLRWYKKQVKAIQDSEAGSDPDDSDEWEDVSDDDEDTVSAGEDSAADVESRPESNITEVSSVVGVLSSMKLDSDADVESVAERMANQRLLGPTECLFCNKKFSSIEINVAHMSRVHGFFIPELEYLTDLEGLLSYLGEKVGVGNVCLWCNERGPAFYSLRAVRMHMRDKGHCRMFTEGDAALEYADYYDFSMSYPDHNPEAEEQSDEEGELELATDAPNQTDVGEDMELVLPSGARIGHRSLMRYYRQNFPTVDRFNQKKRKPLINRLLSQYKAIGWTGSTGAVVIKRHQRDMEFVQKMKSKYVQQLGWKHNKTMMKHFRPQVRF